MRRFLCTTVLSLAALTPAVSAQYPVDNSARLVRSWYQRFLQREPDRQGLSGWVEEVRRGTPPEAVLSGILGGTEYYDRCGDSPEGFVETLFQDLLGRPPNQREFSYWVGRTAYESNQDVAYALLRRYPDSWDSGRYSRDRYEEREYRRPRYRR
jgi:hypothetical protein